ncbi:hypothetical protein PybrP1_000744 [[Pythium] brassicae (nom. inval.)]|nr:hypothetical protein PybrP1_000744 [[Pythium] brassicae (nom. inval.)]
MFADTAPLAETPAVLASLPFGDLVVLNYSAVIAFVYMAWYILLDPLYVPSAVCSLITQSYSHLLAPSSVGSLGAALVYASYLFANFVSLTAPESFGMPGWQVALPVHLVAWTLQFIGHGVFERRKPALLDSLDQALITAPMFVLLEALFALGFRPELFKRVDKQAKINIQLFRAEATKAKAA